MAIYIKENGSSIIISMDLVKILFKQNVYILLSKHKYKVQVDLIKSFEFYCHIRKEPPTIIIKERSCITMKRNPNYYAMKLLNVKEIILGPVILIGNKDFKREDIYKIRNALRQDPLFVSYNNNNISYTKFVKKYKKKKMENEFEEDMDEIRKTVADVNLFRFISLFFFY